MYNGFWLYFWMAALVIAGAVFAAITVVVAVKGGGELVRMFAGKQKTQGTQGTQKKR